MPTPTSNNDEPLGRVHRPRHRVKFPEVLRYANAVEEFREETEEHINWVNALVANISWGLSRKGYTPARVWRELRDHQGELRALLDAMIKGGPAPGPMQVMSEHCGHIRRTLRYEYDDETTDDEYWEDLACEDAIFTGGPPPPLWRRMRRWARRMDGPPAPHTEPTDSPGHEDGSRAEGRPADDAIPATDLPEEPPSYEAFWEPQDALDPLYEQLRLLCETKTIEYLRSCHYCGSYFLALTERLQSYCGDWCRREAHRPPPKENCQSVREYRDRKNQAFLKRIAAAKIRVRSLDPLSRGSAVEVLTLEEVLANVNDKDNMDPDELPISRRRYTALIKYELRKYGKQRATDLTK
jgi:hypothetical protein